MVKIKRVYLPPEASDGRRILVDRLWPRGLKKATAALDDWAKDASPSPELRLWFGHDPAKFPEFRARYLHELQDNPSAANLRHLGQTQTITLVYAAKDEQHNHALVLQEFLQQKS